MVWAGRLEEVEKSKGEDLVAVFFLFFLQTAELDRLHLGRLISPSAGCLRGRGASLLELMEGEINTDYSAASEGFVSFATAGVRAPVASRCF